MAIHYRSIKLDEMQPALFDEFERHQIVNECWRNTESGWQLLPIAFEERWGRDEFEILARHLCNTLSTGGMVVGAFEDAARNQLLGFCSVEGAPFGPDGEYLQLSSIHVDANRRGKGIGKTLFHLAADWAKNKGAKKLYISAHSSRETVAFYHTLGCVDALFINQALVDKEPYDRQLEYTLQRISSQNKK